MQSSIHLPSIASLFHTLKNELKSPAWKRCLILWLALNLFLTGMGVMAWRLAAPALLLPLISIYIANDTPIIWSAPLEGLVNFDTTGNLIICMLSDHKVTTDELFTAGAAFTLFA